ncbi:putative BTB/POZ domain-containing protein [Acanthamoeba castellanii mimivirus]|uniref:Putative BTB/POZ domain-containing protein R738 n=5 Tax=Mimivirus TaxID=315393 RepID=YR738_MIMIV|nr:putative BTB/POZ domain-containing protein [Acanthamoeba polyphaga mimivirus]Q5UNY6.1 RecName: Full=Putative BTB/POZ domain-containing protein R738 [Acanthamoeba polyphaga mimivirus]AHJ40345.1 BTB/POZ domain-containing protein [Samba virus]ALR84361.1 putative BTB/POZ domain-containing protein [Niemeyer virus]AMZ03183.1 putative BTB/POZ domain-containing protein [Mimivirus Bombay]BAV61872.1 putative BTB/POZ domain-containing protein [Acanthamoeba castellanii mimivirus]AAV50998.1 unknown [Ac
MSLQKHGLLFNNNKFSDCKLVLDDGNVQVTLNVHKCLLYMNSLYFQAMFDNFKEQEYSEIKIRVQNSQIATDVIKSFYEKSNVINADWQYQLDYAIETKFFGVEYVLDKNIIVPYIYFDLFVDKIELIGYNNTTLNMILNNLPLDYDLDKFPTDFLEGLLVSSTEYDIFLSNKHCFYVWSVTDNKFTYSKEIPLELYYSYLDNDKIYKFTEHNSLICFNKKTDRHKSILLYDNDKIIKFDTEGVIYYLPENNQIILSHVERTTTGCDYKISLFCLETKQLIRTFHSRNYFGNEIILQISVSHDKIIVFGDDVQVKNFSSGVCLFTINQNESGVCIACDPEWSYFAIGSEDYDTEDQKITIYDLSNGNKVKTLNHRDSIRDILWTSKYIIAHNNENIYFYETNNYELVKKLDYKNNGLIKKIDCFDDSEFLYVLTNNSKMFQINMDSLENTDSNNISTEICFTQIGRFCDFKTIKNSNYHKSKLIKKTLEQRRRMDKN